MERNLLSSPCCMRALSLEEQLLVAFSRINPDIDEINNLLAHPLDWHFIQERASLHGLVPLVYHHLGRLHMEVIPSWIIESFRQGYYENLARNLTLFQELNKILKALNDHGIEVIVLKGAALLETIYRNPALRPLSDLDILVKRQDLSKAERCLLDLGYSIAGIEFSRWWAERFAGERLYVKGTDLPVYVDMHWYITNYVWIYNDRRQANRIWSRAQIVKIAGTNALSLSVEDLILHISIHFAKHLKFRLIWLRDIGEIIRHYQERIDWKEIVTVSRQLGIEGVMYYTLKHTQELLKVRVPEKVIARFDSAQINTLEKKFFNLHINSNEVEIDNIKLLYQYFKIPKISEKIKFLFCLAFPSLAYMRKRYSIPKSRLVYLYYLYRPCYIFYQASLTLFRLIRLLIAKG